MRDAARRGHAADAPGPCARRTRSAPPRCAIVAGAALPAPPAETAIPEPAVEQAPPPTPEPEPIAGRRAAAACGAGAHGDGPRPPQAPAEAGCARRSHGGPGAGADGGPHRRRHAARTRPLRHGAPPGGLQTSPTPARHRVRPEGAGSASAASRASRCRGRSFIVLTEADAKPQFTVTTVITEKGVPLRKIETALPHPLAREEDVQTVRRQLDLQHDEVLRRLDDWCSTAGAAACCGRIRAAAWTLRCWPGHCRRWRSSPSRRSAPRKPRASSI